MQPEAASIWRALGLGAAALSTVQPDQRAEQTKPRRNKGRSPRGELTTAIADGYNVQSAVDTETHLIVAQVVSRNWWKFEGGVISG